MSGNSRAMIWLWWHISAGHARTRRLRTIVQVLAIVVGVALGYSVSLINTAALSEFNAALRAVNGEADAAIEGPRSGFDEQLFARVAAHPGVALASPVLATDVFVIDSDARLSILGVDALRAGWITPGLLPDFSALPPAADDAEPASRFALFADGIYLSPAALARFGVQPGGQIQVQAGERRVVLAVRGSLPATRPGQLLGVMDLGFAQWRLDRLGLLTRIDLRLLPGMTPGLLAKSLALPAGVTIAGPDADEARLATLSRAYRVNLNVLALVALFTGCFLVFSLQVQAALARRPQLAYLRAAGLTAGELQMLLLAEAATVGIVGSTLGLLLGAAMAHGVLGALGGDLGGDLGGGFLGSFAPELRLPATTTAGYATLGVLAAIAGGLAPAREAARKPIAPALRAGAEEDALQPLGRLTPGLLLITAAALLVWLPAVSGVSLAAYAAIGCLLIGVIALQPRLAGLAFRPVARRLEGSPLGVRWPMLLLATNRLARAPGGAAISMAGIVASFGLMVAMATMVASFRGSLEDWLYRVLPADVYARIGQLTTSTWFSPEDLQRIESHPSVAHVEFSRVLSVPLAPDRVAVAVIARPVDATSAADVLPLVGAEVPLPAGASPAWVSEAMVDLYDAQPGEELALPLAGRLATFTVAGVWRDYARQFGSVVVRTEDYERLTGDTTRTEAALWLRSGAIADDVIRDLKGTVPSGSAVRFNATGEIRALSLRAFDRSFAVTYVLEIAAILIGMIGVAATFSAQAIARTREFGMLRHLGITRSQVLRVLALEGALTTGHALLVGLVTGLLVSLVLIRVVNRQSFHWTMDFAAPAALIATLCIALLVCATVTAALAGRRATGVSPLRAVHEDW